MRHESPITRILVAGKCPRIWCNFFHYFHALYEVTSWINVYSYLLDTADEMQHSSKRQVNPCAVQLPHSLRPVPRPTMPVTLQNEPADDRIFFIDRPTFKPVGKGTFVRFDLPA